MISSAIMTECEKMVTNPSLWVFWVGSMFLYIFSLWTVLDLSRVNITKLIFAGILFGILSFGLLYLIMNSPILINSLFVK